MRYSLRTLLLIMTVACPLAALIGWVGFEKFAWLMAAMWPLFLMPVIKFVEWLQRVER